VASEHCFGLHPGHLPAWADEVARRHGAWHVNYTEPDGTKRGWFACINRGSPFDDNTARVVLTALEDEGLPPYESLEANED